MRAMRITVAIQEFKIKSRGFAPALYWPEYLDSAKPPHG